MSLPSLTIGKLTPRLPIVQGGMAVRISLAPLAAAVANEGGIGLIAASGLAPDELADNIREARRISDGIIGINIMVAAREFARLVRVALEEGIDLIVAGAGFSRDVFKWCAEADVPFVPIISEPRGAVVAQRLGAAAVVLEGKQAGGHLGTLESTWDLLPKIVEAVKIPVIAAGGILTGADILRALKMGAKGVQMGSRFALSVESSAAPGWKQACLDAKPEDVVLIESPVGLPGRGLNLEFVQRIRNNDPALAKVKCVSCLKECKKNFCIITALEKARQGDLRNGLVFCGERIGEIKDILTVKEIFKMLLEQYEEAVNTVGAYA